MKRLLEILLDELGGTLAITRVTSGTVATAVAMAARDAEIEAVVNGAIEAGNIADDAVTAAKINSDVVRADYGLVQHTDGTLYVDVSDTNPSLELTDGGLRAKVYGLINRTANGLTFGRSGDILLSTISTALNGWTDVSATYADKFIRISATALSTGGADTHTHAVGSYSTAAHSHTGYTGGVSFSGSAGSNTAGALDTQHRHSISEEAATAITGTSASGDNVPAYVTLVMFQKD